MKPSKKKKLIISLIKDDLVNAKLVNYLQEMGLDAGHYFLNLGDTVFNLMGFKNNDEKEIVFERYMKLTRQSMHLNISTNRKALDQLSVDIYMELWSKRKG